MFTFGGASVSAMPLVMRGIDTGKPTRTGVGRNAGAGPLEPGFERERRGAEPGGIRSPHRTSHTGSSR